MKKVWILTLCLIMCATMLAAQTVQTRQFQVSWSPSNEVPPLSTVNGFGDVLVSIHWRTNDAGEVEYAVVDFAADFTLGQAETLVAMHIHRGADGVNGPVVIDSNFGSPLPAEPGQHRIWRQAVIQGDDAMGIATVQAVLANPAGYYVNIHSVSNPAGLMRGQLQMTDLAATTAASAQLSSLEAKVDALQAQTDAIDALLRRVALKLFIVP